MLNTNALTPTLVFKTYWKFAAARQRIYLRRLAGEEPPWTDNLILRAHKFTNTFRVADRVSQYCIRPVIYGHHSMEPEEVVFRVLLFKLFNSIPMWETLTDAFGLLTWKTFDASAYATVLGQARARGANIWNMAYVQNQKYRTDLPTKHERYLALLEHMMRSGVTHKLQEARTYEQAFRVPQTFPLHGKRFLPMQHLTDLNYSPVVNFDEDAFIVPGPGAFDGINKCFGLSLSETNAQDVKAASAIINMCVAGQEGFFEHYGETPVTLFGRRLHAIDCQNLFCETDKYARVAHPEFNRGRTEIKQKLKPAGPLPAPYFPPKWKLAVATGA